MSQDIRDGSIDLVALQRRISKTPESRLCSSPVYSTAPLPSRPGASPAKTTSDAPSEVITSHDRTGDLQLEYSAREASLLPSIPNFSQISTGPTQVATPCGLQVQGTPDHNTQRALRPTPEDPAAAHSPEGVAATPEQASLDSDFDILAERTTYFPEDQRFPGPREYETPDKKLHNPLLRLGYVGNGGRNDLTMAQLFEHRSSPTASTPFKHQRRSSSLAPPTPAGEAATLMAKSFSGPPTVAEEGSQGSTRKDPDTPVHSQDGHFSSVPTEPLEKYVTIPESSPEQGASPTVQRRASRSKTPVVPTMPTTARQNREQDDDSQDSILSMEERSRRKARAQAARKKGDLELAKFFPHGAGVNASRQRAAIRGHPTDSTHHRGHSRDDSQKTVSDFEGAQGSEDRGEEDSVDTQIISELEPTQLIPGSNAHRSTNEVECEAADSDPASEDDGISETGRGPHEGGREPGEHSTQPFRSRSLDSQVPVNENPARQPKSVKYIPTEEDWKRIHGISDIAHSGTRGIRRVRSTGGMKDGQTLELLHTNTLLPGGEATYLKQGRSQMSVKHMVPFNLPPMARLPTPPDTSSEIPSPPVVMPPMPTAMSSIHRTPTSNRHNSFAPLVNSPFKQTRNRETQTSFEGFVATTASRSPRLPPVQETNDVIQPKSFAAIDGSGPLFSSREEPEDIDMISIVRSVGAGDQPELEMPTPSGPPSTRGSARKRKRPREESTSSSGLEMNTPVPMLPPPAPNLPDLPVSDAPATPALDSPAAYRSVSMEEAESSDMQYPVPPEPKRVKKSKEKPNKAKQNATTQETPAPKAPGRRASTLRHVTSASAVMDSSFVDSPTPARTSPLGDEDTESTSDILASNDPNFSLSQRTEPFSNSDRVFALFKDQKLNYYPAKFLCRRGPQQVEVEFDDGTRAVVSMECVRTLDLRKDDHVKVDLRTVKKGQTWMVQSLSTQLPENSVDDFEGLERFTDVRGNSFVTLAAKPGKAAAAPAEEITVPVTKIYLVKNMWGQFLNRDKSKALLVRETTPTSFPHNSSDPTTPHTNSRRTNTPSFMANSSGSFTAARPGGIFFPMIFAISLSDEKDGQRKRIADRIKKHGGHVVENDNDEGFMELFRSGSASLSSGAETAGFACVIANTHNRKPKFLQALALGIPCLALKWLDDCIRESRVLDWELYLLPAGQSKYLGTVRSRTSLAAFDPVTARLKDIIERRAKLLKGKNVVVVREHLVGKKKEKKREHWDDKKTKSYMFFVRVLGAASAVHTMDLTQAQGALTAIDTLLVDKTVKEKAAGMYPGLVVKSDEDLQEALILGKGW